MAADLHLPLLRAGTHLLSPGGDRARLSILIFHRVLRTANAMYPDAPSIEQFDATMRWVREQFTVLPLDEAMRLLDRDGLPPRAAAITFDDGNLSDATIALPALAARGLKASFFVCAGRIGQPGYLDRPALRDLLSAGMAIGSHGWHHVDWRRADEPNLERETKGALDEIAAVIGQVVDEVGVPFGSYDRRVLARLRSSGVRTVYTSDGGRAPLSAWLVPRLSYATNWTDSTLREVASRPDSSVNGVKRKVILAMKRLR